MSYTQLTPIKSDFLLGDYMEIEKMTEGDAWFIRGVCFALGSLFSGDGAKEILNAAGVESVEDMADADVNEADYEPLIHLFY